MKLYFHPLSAYSQKVLVALYEKNADFTPVIVDMFDPASKVAYLKTAPLGKIPLLLPGDGQPPVFESSIIIEHLDEHVASGPRLVPNDEELARRARFEDRLADNYLTEPLVKILRDGFRPAEQRDPVGVAEARALLDRIYALLDVELAKKTWALGDTFSMADCAYAPPLAYLQQIHPFAKHKHLTAYFHRLAERPSFARVLAEAKPYLAKLSAASSDGRASGLPRGASTEELVLAYWRSWQKPDFAEMRSYLADTLDLGGRTVSADAFTEMCSKGSKWTDVRLIDSVFTADAATLLYESVEAKSGAKTKVVEFVRVAGGRVVGLRGLYLVDGKEVSF